MDKRLEDWLTSEDRRRWLESLDKLEQESLSFWEAFLIAVAFAAVCVSVGYLFGWMAGA